MTGGMKLAIHPIGGCVIHPPSGGCRVLVLPPEVYSARRANRCATRDPHGRPFVLPWLRCAWEVGIHGSDAGIGHDRMATIRNGRARRVGWGMAYAAAGYCAIVVRCRTW